MAGNPAPGPGVVGKKRIRDEANAEEDHAKVDGKSSKSRASVKVEGTDKQVEKTKGREGTEDMDSRHVVDQEAKTDGRRDVDGNEMFEDGEIEQEIEQDIEQEIDQEKHEEEPMREKWDD